MQISTTKLSFKQNNAFIFELKKTLMPKSFCMFLLSAPYYKKDQLNCRKKSEIRMSKICGKNQNQKQII